jgi:hypothetical protein
LYSYFILILLQKSPVPNVEKLTSTSEADIGQLQQQQQQQQQVLHQEPSAASQPAIKTQSIKSQLANVIPDESYCCTTSITPRQRPKPSSASIVSTQLGSSPVLKRALFPNALGHSGTSQSPEVTNSFGNPSTIPESVDARFQHTSESARSPSVMEKAKLDDLFPPYSGEFRR